MKKTGDDTGTGLTGLPTAIFVLGTNEGLG